MHNYFSGNERLETFQATGAPMRMGDISKLTIPDYQVLRNLLKEKKWDEIQSYLAIFHGQNTGMNSLLFDWCLTMVKRYAELTSPETEKKMRPEAISDYQKMVEGIGKVFSAPGNNEIIQTMKNFFTVDNLSTLTAADFFAGMEKDLKNLTDALKEKNEEKSLKLINSFHNHAVIRHDSLISFIYSYPTTVMKNSGEAHALDVGNGSMLKNPIWNGLWELTKVLNPIDLAAFLAEHLRFHFSGDKREGQTLIVEDDKKVRLIMDPCGSGGALRRRLGSEVKNLQEKHFYGWNKTNEVNLYCSHCALNEKHSINLFGYPKLVVEFQADPQKPCGWTFYKNKEDIPKEVYERLGLKKP